MARIAVIYYSATGTNESTARAVADGAEAAGHEVRLRLVRENAPTEAIASNPAWKAFHERMASQPVAEIADLEWADAIVFGSPTRYGNIAAQLKAFIDSTGGIWAKGGLANKVYAGFTSSMNAHGGQESTLLALYNSFYHFGGFIVTPGYTDPVTFASGGNPYGVSVTTGTSGNGPTAENIAHAKYLGRRVGDVADRLKPPSASGTPRVD